MSPIDDELRAALHARAATVSPAPDPFPGVERRARRIRRNRVAASVAGTALTVAAIAVAVPVLSPDGGRTPAPVATAPPSESPSPAPSANPFALDLADPWEYRGDPAVLEDGNLETFAREWAVRHDAEPGAVRFVPLFGQVYEPSAQPELVFAAQAPGGEPFWGVVESTESGPEFVLDQPLAPETTALPAALPGDEVARLLVVASPMVGQIDYGHDDASEWSPMTELAPGVAITPLDGDPATDMIRVLDGDGDLDNPVFQGPAPDVAGVEPPGGEEPGGEGPGTETPPDVDTAGYAFDPADPWAFRGDEEATDLAVADEELFTAAGSGRDDGSWSQRPLLALRSADTGVSVLMMLHTSPGRDAVVTTTWQRGDRAPEQTEQVVDGGELLLRSTVPTDLDDGSELLVALASPRAGAMTLTQGQSVPGARTQEEVETRLQQTPAIAGVGVWTIDADEPGPWIVRLYTDDPGGTGRLYHTG